MKDYIIHSIVTVAITSLTFFFKEAGIVLAVLFFYFWELAQRIAKDKVHAQYNDDWEKHGILYWAFLFNWGNTAIKEAFVPLICSVLTLGVLWSFI